MTVVVGPVHRDRRGFLFLHQRDGRLRAREDDLRPRCGDDERIIANEFSSNLRRAFPLPCDGQEGDDRFRVLLDALKQVHAR